MVPIPDRMKALPFDRRGLPVPVTVYVDHDGKPHFTINDEAKRQHMIMDDRCSICGGKLLRGRWFVGGPMSAFDPEGAYIDPPMHHECAHYALRVCPYLAAPSYSKRVDDRTLGKERDDLILIDPTMIAERPEYFVAVLARGQDLVIYEKPVLMVRYIKPRRPYIRVEHWRHGRRIK